MINYETQERDRLNVGVPDDVLLFGQNHGTLAQIAADIRAMVEATRRAESPNPTIWPLANGRDALGAFPSQTTARFRVSKVVVGNISLAAAVPLGLQIGNEVLPLGTFNVGVTLELTFPKVMDVGTTVTLWNMTTNAAADQTKCIGYLVAYTELETTAP